MWIQFAPPAVRWLMYGLFVVCVIGILLMPKEERRRMLGAARRRRTRRSQTPTADFGSPPSTPWTSDVGAGSPVPHAPSRSLERLGGAAFAARVVFGVGALGFAVLLVWMAIAFLLNLPGWR